MMKFDQNAKKLIVVSGSSVVSVWSSCPPPGCKVGIRVAKKFWFFRFTFNKFQPKDNSVVSSSPPGNAAHL